MADKVIRVLIVDDLPETRENVRKLLQFESDIEVIGQAGTGEEAIEMAQKHSPDIILMDINMPGIDGIQASQRISELAPRAQIIIMSVQSDSDYLRRAMLAGARDFLTKPFGGDELVAAVRRVYKKRPAMATAPLSSTGALGASGQVATGIPVREGRIVSVFSPKGGAGCSTIAVNLGVALAKRNQRTLLMDGSLQFGDVAVMLNLKQMTSIVDLIEHASETDPELIESVVQLHRSGLSVLLSPPRPEMADIVTEDRVKDLLESFRRMYDFVIIDTSAYLSDKVLTMLDVSDRIVLVTQQSLPDLKNVSRFYDLAENLEYEQDKTWLVVNRASNKQGISVKDISSALKRPVTMVIPSDEIAAGVAADQGVPLVTNSSRQPISVALNSLADHVLQELGDDATAEGATGELKESGLLGRLFGGRAKAGG
ncbi:MAG: response regulator [Ardenticatenaceae bacterium]|nr:response regulator [Ardenticatenaceae bacterium]